MRAHSTLLTLIVAIALLSGIGASEATGNPAPNRPGPDEVILHVGPHFGADAAYRFKIKPGMRQLTAYLQGNHLTARNFKSIQVGRDVIASVYKSRPGNIAAGYDGRKFVHSATDIKPVYSILVVNRKRDGRADRGYRGLPFRVTVGAQWKTALSGGRLRLDEYFVAQSATHRQDHDLSGELQRHGADWIILNTGRYPTNSMRVVFFDKKGAGGNNARSFPTDPKYASNYSLWDHGYGDKARSLRIKWTGPEFGKKGNAPGNPGPNGNSGGQTAPGGPMQFLVPDVRGSWRDQIGTRYEIGAKGKLFAWKAAAIGERGNGVFETATRVRMRWASGTGAMSKWQPGTVEHDANWRATKITFPTGGWLAREGSAPQKQNSAANLSGTWNSVLGKVVLKHQGSTIKGTLYYTTGGKASLQGTIQGKTIKVNWLANLLAHGHGTFTIAPNGRSLSGHFVDVVSKKNGTWTLTR